MILTNILLAVLVSAAPTPSASGFACLPASDCAKSTVRLEASANGMGLLTGMNPKRPLVASGFAIDKDYIITAAHFCNGAIYSKSIDVNVVGVDTNVLTDTLELVDLGKARIKIVNAPVDACFLYKPDHGIEPVVFNTGKMMVGVASVGAPLGFFPVVRRGEIVSNAMNSKVPIAPPIHNGKLAFAVRVSPGNSGGPLYDVDGFVVGMVTQVLAGDGEIGFAVPAKTLIVAWNMAKRDIAKAEADKKKPEPEQQGE